MQLVHHVDMRADVHQPLRDVLVLVLHLCPEHHVDDHIPLGRSFETGLQVIPEIQVGRDDVNLLLGLDDQINDVRRNFVVGLDFEIHNLPIKN